MRTVQNIYSALKQKLQSGEWPDGTRLPSLAELSKLFSASRTTVWRAVALLQKESLLHATERGPIISGRYANAYTVQDTKKPAIARGLLWQRLKTQLGRDILNGGFPAVRLPPAAKLSLRYGVTVPTLHKALGQLVREGILEENGHHFQQIRSGSRLNWPKVMLIVGLEQTGDIGMLEGRTQTLTESFERECPRMRLDGRIEGFNPIKATGLLEICSMIEDASPFSGFIVNIWNPWNEKIWSQWVALLTNLASKKVPVVIIDQAGDLSFPPALLRSSYVRVLRIAGEQAGAKVAESLFRHGHRQITYISPGRSDWAQARYRGLCAYFQHYVDPQSRIDFFHLRGSVSNFELIFSLLNLDERGVRALHHNQYSDDQIRGLFPLIERAAKLRLNRNPSSHALIETLSPAMEGLCSVMDKEHDATAFLKIQQVIGIAASAHAFAMHLSSLFHKVLTTSAADAWVCCNDQTALAAVSYLKSRKKRVPGDISVIGFDNWRESNEQQVSTFDFNMDGMIKESLLMIVDAKSLRARAAISEVDGYVVERRTTLRQGSVQARR
jgi:DNA-binding LacI/PurR family transcriptional regulator/DNA-binding transcriptional regulator YhcF (GntR family)